MNGIMKYINRIARSNEVVYANRLRGYGITQSQPGIPQEKISREICVNKSSVTRQITILEEKGLIVRKQDQTDRRVWRVYPTQRMQELLPHVRQVMKEWNEYLLEEFDEEQREHLIAALEQLARRAQDAAKENLKGRERQP